MSWMLWASGSLAGEMWVWDTGGVSTCSGAAAVKSAHWNHLQSYLERATADSGSRAEELVL